VRYIDAAAIEKECRDFGGVLKENPNVFVESFMNAPSPGIVAAAGYSALTAADKERC
jgi:hypothetical protein